MIMLRCVITTLAVCMVLLLNAFTSEPALAAGDADAGSRLFRACIGCHSLKPDETLTGPSLAHVWGRKAGTLESFRRYSMALKNSGLVWNEETLGRWIAAPQKLEPGTYLAFRGISDKQQRDDLVAFLKYVSEGTTNSQTAQMMMRQPRHLGPRPNKSVAV